MTIDIVSKTHKQIVVRKRILRALGSCSLSSASRNVARGAASDRVRQRESMTGTGREGGEMDEAPPRGSRGRSTYMGQKSTRVGRDRKGCLELKLINIECTSLVLLMLK